MSRINTKVLFTPFACVEVSPDTPASEIKEILSKIKTSLEETQEVRTLQLNEEKHYYSTIGKNPVRVGGLVGDHIFLEGSDAHLAIYPGELKLVEGQVYLNGKRIKPGSYLLSIGDGLWIDSTYLEIHEKYIGVGGHHLSRLNISMSTPNPYEEFPIYKRSPRLIKRTPTDRIELNPPEAKEERKKGELIMMILPPLVTSLVTVGGGILIGRGLFILISAAAMVVSLVFSVTKFIGDKRERKKKEKERDITYDKYLLAKRKEIYSLQKAQRDSLLYHNLSPKEIEQEIRFYSSRLYERGANDSDFLTLSLGNSTVPSSYTLKYEADLKENEKDPLFKEMLEVGASAQSLKDMPTVIDLKEAHLGLVGEKPYIHRQLTSILTQLCFFQSYHDIEIILLAEEEDRLAFEWVRWYPHCKIKSINVTGFITAENHRDQVLGNVAQVLKMRRQKQEEEKKDGRYLPHYIFVVDNPKLIINHSIMEYLQIPDTTLGFSVVYTTHIQANLPEYIKTVFLLEGGDNGILLMNQGRLENRRVHLPEVAGIDLEMMARRLTALKHSQGVSTQIPEAVSFFELYQVKRPEEIPVMELWNKNNCHKSLSVPLGLRGKDDMVFLNLHEKAHGPHGLVAGTTGSGKSEIVQSYILSLAVNFHPHEVGFLLIDYKGGGMANLFNKLPHLLGTITNLDGSESMRALASIKSELARRQRIFNAHNVNNINQYTKLFKAKEASEPMPHLFLISDEFAELKKEQPEFMTELVSAARIGRSLGVHLILATQKPSGVVDDQIWSNSKFKLALKVANASDSNEVLKTPDAARITQPGRAYLQVGNNEIYELFQSAWSGAPYSEDTVERGFDKRVYAINQLGQGVLLNEDLSEVDKAEDSKLTQLDVVVDHIHDLYQELEAEVVAKPWLPPLPDKLVNEIISQRTGMEAVEDKKTKADIAKTTKTAKAAKTAKKKVLDVGKIKEQDLSVPIAMADIPEEQAQTQYIHDFMEDGNLAIFGAAGFGKSTVLMNTALTLATQNAPKLLHYFILDYGNSSLAQLRGLPHTADYLGIDDEEKLGKVEKLLTEELKTRKHLFANANALNFRMYNQNAKEKLPAIIVMIDNYDVIKEIAPNLEGFLVKVTRDGIGVGIYTVLTASRASAVRYTVLNNFKNKMTLFMTDKSEVTSAVGRCEYEVPEKNGRALVKLKDVHVAQCYLPYPHEDDLSYANGIGEMVSKVQEHNSGGQATGVAVLADTITYEDLTPHLKVEKKQAIVGLDVESTEPVYLDLSINNHLITGTPATGKTNLLNLLLTQFSELPCFVADSKAGDLADFEDKKNVTYLGEAGQLEDFCEALGAEIKNRAEQCQVLGLKPREYTKEKLPMVVVIDDVDHFVELSKAKLAEVEQLLTAGKDLGLVIISTSLHTKLRGYDNITKMIKETESGVALGAPIGQLPLPVPVQKGHKATPEIGFWFKRGEVKQMKIPFMGEEEE